MSTDTLSWDALLRTVRSDHPHLYRSWFEDLKPLQLSGGQLQVVVPESAQTRYLRDHCTDSFVQAAMAISGHLVTVSFLSEGELAGGGVLATSEPGLSQTDLNPDYTFDEFVVGPSNRLAHAACRAVCQQPGTLYNPLFIHGASGLGKSHLLQATCDQFQRVNPGATAAYVSCEVFVNDFIRAIETGRLAVFRNSARKCDVLVIDDVQFLANRESSQEELFHTFNALYQSRRQIILSADSPPSEIPTLEERLISRFNWGLVAQIDTPNRETRQAILQKKARLRGCEIPAEILDYIAERVDANIRLLEGALTKLITETELGGKPMNLETARAILPSYDGRDQRPLQISDILQTVCEHFGIRTQDLLGRKRTRSISQPRQIAMYLARKLTPLSLEEIGAHFGGRDHSTVIHAERVVQTDCEQDDRYADTIQELSRRLLTK